MRVLFIFIFQNNLKVHSFRTFPITFVVLLSWLFFLYFIKKKKKLHYFIFFFIEFLRILLISKFTSLKKFIEVYKQFLLTLKWKVFFFKFAVFKNMDKIYLYLINCINLLFLIIIYTY
ncbi:hypothetical protein YYC_03550 [Plasmodium yoelii 17X]|uniref:Uncharacterized protein n=1 Tax=Plasmodium yoelii 17X TaxID=1323249 RepID=V7PGQ0_PLAYE|nr:hypothetical protein YYC_03550 [Plasmodium yoelii 17X]